MVHNHRDEMDSIGTWAVPVDALYGIQTARALDNFNLSDVRLKDFPEIVVALVMVKKAAALANAELGAISVRASAAIVAACNEIIAGRHHDAFAVDMIQGGAGTSTNMNANEVIANLAALTLGRRPGDYRDIHPNDTVNRSQSTNDVYPTAMRLAVLSQCAPLVTALEGLCRSFDRKAVVFSGIRKVGRTQLQDAVPITLGEEFAAFSAAIRNDIRRLTQISEVLREVNLGGTAVGTGVNAPRGYQALAVSKLSAIFGTPLTAHADLLAASYDQGAFVTYSGILKRVAVKLSKISNDLRLLSSGPLAGIGEIRLPPVQAGSSIMPGKVNPVIPEAVNQVAYEVIGRDVTVTMAAEAGQLQLNAMEPVMVYSILQSTRLLTRAVRMLDEKCVAGIEADRGRCAELLDKSMAMAASLVPVIGYDKAARAAKLALAQGISLREAVLREGFPQTSELEELLPAPIGKPVLQPLDQS
ncbi:aspartate ammonia-lyase [Sagittula stellata]|uniref:Aspartate ammonia-lyase n=1 Tax=Sagittula stellata (strain ATCC 700073 / DSM 11524 / E-37) TaxID=388399 RepID=A3K4G4_SAGS3|nr:aspartate ammonia-lyase [Sagittula stellata]EBA07863.1 aspartate ammonia-lyase [Sagittula stellata E-37]